MITQPLVGGEGAPSPRERYIDSPVLGGWKYLHVKLLHMWMYVCGDDNLAFGSWEWRGITQSEEEPVLK